MASQRPTPDEIFNTAAEIDDAVERASFLDRACGADAKLREQIENLLRHDRDAGSFMQSASRSAIGVTAAMPPESAGPGTTIGAYRLLEQIGEGGFGIVYMADQQAPVHRRVALKIIKPGMDTRQVLARFEAERQALALMDHPNIARALDAGATDSGRPYFIMELVKGVPITDYCDQNNLPVHERLDLFVQVCHAVQHAHQKGIIHRDIKPSNVLVAIHDGRAIPKIIDFGVAKAINQHLTQETIFTRVAEMIGTPLYMSPEQAETTSLDIDTRSDVYSLGVLLYELLTGTTPFEKERLKQAAYDEIRRIIREEEPPTPSTRISTLGDTGSAVAAHRHADLGRLSQIVRGDLDWIVMKALEKDRTRRYDTASNFAADVLRYLSDLPVEACPPSAAYRFKKFARRNRVVLATVALVATALVVGTVVSTTQAIRAKRAETLAEGRLQAETAARNEAEQERKVAEQERRVAEQERQAAERARQAEANQRKIAEAERVEADANFRKARQAVDEYFTLVSENRLFDVPGLQPLRKQLLEAALRYYQGFLERRSADPNLIAQVAATHLRIAHIYEQSDRSTDAILALWQGLQIVEELLRNNPQHADLLIHLAGVRRGGRTSHLWEKGTISDIPDAVRAYQKAASLWETLSRENPASFEVRNDLAAFYWRIGDLQWSQYSYVDALAAFQSARQIWETLARENPKVPEYRADLAESLDHIGKVLMETGKRDESIAAYRLALDLRQTLVAELPNYAEYRAGLANGFRRLGTAYDTFGQLQEAERSFRASLAIWEKLSVEYPHFPAYRKLLSAIYELLGRVLHEANRIAEAETAYRRSLDIGEQLVLEFPGGDGNCVQDFATTLSILADMLTYTGRPQEAEQLFRQRLQIYSKAIEQSPQSAPVYVARGQAYLALKLPDNAIADVSKGIDLAPHDTAAPWWHLALASGYAALKQTDKQLAELTMATELWPRLFDVWVWRGGFYQDLQKWDKVVADYSKVIELNPYYTSAWLERATAYTKLDQPEKAVADLRQAIEKGLPNAEQMIKNDPRFEPLRSRKDFQDVLQELENKTKK